MQYVTEICNVFRCGRSYFINKSMTLLSIIYLRCFLSLETCDSSYKKYTNGFTSIVKDWGLRNLYFFIFLILFGNILTALKYIQHAVFIEIGSNLTRSNEIITNGNVADSRNSFRFHTACERPFSVPEYIFY